MSSRQARRRQQRVRQQGSGGRSAQAVRRGPSAAPWYLSPVGLGGIVAAGIVAVIVVVSILNSLNGGGNSFTSEPAAATILNPVVNASPSLVSKVGNGGIDSPWKTIKNPPTKMLTYQGKPVFFFWGGEFCPICAADRWSIINAVSRFGKLSGIYTMKSSSTDIFPDTNTFTFKHAKYSSKYISFRPVEAESRSESLYPVPGWAQHLVTTYDAAPYVQKQSAGGFPFIDLANRAIGGIPANENEGVFHTDEANVYSSALSWNEIASRLTDPSTDISQSVFGNANWLTAGICTVDGNKPATVCTAAPIPTLEKSLKFKP